MPKTKDGIACPKCHSRHTPVYYTRQKPPVVKRVRKCADCGHRFPTVECLPGTVR